MLITLCFNRQTFIYTFALVSARMKKGETSASGVATLIGFLTALIVVYMLIMPANEREQLLGTIDGGNDGGISQPSSDSVLSSVVGTLISGNQSRSDHSLPVLRLEDRKNANVLLRARNIELSGGFFSRASNIFLFSLKSPEEFTASALTLDVPVHDGKLRIVLNNVTIFDKFVDSSNPPSIIFDASILRKDNVLILSVSARGLFFWRPQNFVVKEAVVIGDRIDVSARSSDAVVSIPSGEFYGVRSGILSFFVNCVQSQVESLYLSVNNHTVFSGSPSCGGSLVVDVSRDVLLSGRNVISATTSRGSIVLSDGRFVLSVVANAGFKDSFVLNTGESSKSRFLELTFPSSDEKIFRWIVNSHDERVVVRSRVFRKDITLYTSEGPNTVRIIPEDSVTITKLEVRVQ